MYQIAGAAQMKELDRQAIEEYGVSSLGLMERAAQAVAEEVRGLLEGGGPDFIGGADSVKVLGAGAETEEDRRELEALQALAEEKNQNHAPWVGVLCGPGNNGGDGVAAARILRGMGFRVRAFLVGDRRKMTPDERAMEKTLAEAGGVLEEFRPEDRRQMLWLSLCGCLVDALFGVGLSRPVEGDALLAVRLMQGRSPLKRVVSCDIPSGVHADTGAVLGEAVRADRTVTFTCAKPGLYLGEGASCAGLVTVADIGIPHRLIFGPGAQMRFPVGVMGYEDVVLPRRKRDSHKGDYGRVLILAGSVGYTGAPVLAASGAVRGGAGLVSLGVPEEIWPIAAVKCLEAMPFPLPARYEDILRRASSCEGVLIGPGLGRAPRTERLVRSLLEDLKVPVVLDADGINALDGHIDSLDGRRAPTILTPHAGEFARLTGRPLPLEDPLTAARDFARDHRCVLVLKGHRTVTAAPDGRAWINTTGNPGMSKGGSGDVLAGLILALLGQGWEPELAARDGVYLHGEAGDRCAGSLGEYGMTPGDLVERLPETLEAHVRSGS